MSTFHYYRWFSIIQLLKRHKILQQNKKCKLVLTYFMLVLVLCLVGVEISLSCANIKVYQNLSEYLHYLRPARTYSDVIKSLKSFVFLQIKILLLLLLLLLLFIIIIIIIIIVNNC